jgi:hypothetical protein
MRTKAAGKYSTLALSLLLVSAAPSVSGNWTAVGRSFSVRIPEGWQDISKMRGAAPNQAFLALLPPGEETTKGAIVSPNGALIVVSDDGTSADPNSGIQNDIDQHRGIEFSQTQERIQGSDLVKTVQVVRWREDMTTTFAYQNVEDYFAIGNHVLSVALMYRVGNPRSDEFERALREVLISMRRRKT